LIKSSFDKFYFESECSKISEVIDQPAQAIATYSWKDVFDCKIYYGTIYKMAEMAHKCGYSLFDWNDRLYKFTSESLTWEDLGLVKDLVK
jgi:hypothetical protein